jgi:lipid-A-disaccharide synthase
MSHCRAKRVRSFIVRIFLSTGELSGDAHAAHLVRALRTEAAARGIPLEIAAIGSRHLKEVVDELWEDTLTWAGIGIIDSIRVGPKVTAGFRRVKARMEAWKPDLVIGVDYRVVNVRLLQAAQAIGAKTVYYFPPVSWGTTTAKARQTMVRLYEGKEQGKKKLNRFDRVAACTDLVLLTYPISEAEYIAAGANVHYIGHPLWNALQSELNESPDDVRARYGVAPMSDAPGSPLLVGVFPGSREQELRDIWPILREFLRTRGPHWTHVTWLVSVSHPRYRPQLERDVAALPLAVRKRTQLIDGMDPNVLRAMDLVLMKSGTAAQTALLLGIPMVSFYRFGLPPILGPIILAVSRSLFMNLPFYTFPNLIAGRAVIPELTQEGFTLDRLTAAVEPLLADPAARAAQAADLHSLQDRLIRPDALTKAASMSLDLLGSTPP